MKPVKIRPELLRRAEGLLRKLTDEIRARSLDDTEGSITRALRAAEDALSRLRVRLENDEARAQGEK